MSMTGMKNRPLVDLLHRTMRAKGMRTVTDLVNACKGVISKPTVYSVLAGSTPIYRVVKTLAQVLDISPDIAKVAFEDQREIDKSLKRKTAVDKGAIKLTGPEKRFFKKLRKVSKRARELIYYVIETDLLAQDAANTETD